MTEMNVTRTDPRTASQDKSVWFDLPEERFRQHLVSLQERTGPTPMDPQVFSIGKWFSISPSVNESYVLPVDIEQQLADDFAFLAAVAEGAQSVAAVCIEENSRTSGMTLRFAAMDVSKNEAVKMALQGLCSILSRAATLGSDESSFVPITPLFHHIIQLHFHRLLARLRSSKWEKPKYLSKSHKKPLWKDFANLVHRAQHTYSKKEKTIREMVENRLKELAMIYEHFEASEDQMSSMMELVNVSFIFSLAEEIKDYSQRLQNSTKHTHQVASAIKTLRQIQKIASYRRICLLLVSAARKYPSLFQQVRIEYLVPYMEVPTSIGYHEWATTCHVHAEVQLAVYYDLNRNYRPRCIGTSKWLCYLCYQFLSAHNQFFPSKTHGRMFDQWTLPDLMEFNEALVQDYRRILKEMDGTVLQQIENEPQVRKLQRMTSCDFGEFDQI
jgi:OTT_1508-like deaminase